MFLTKKKVAGCGKSQHLGGSGRQISEFKTSMVYRVNSRIARDTQRKLLPLKTK